MIYDCFDGCFYLHDVEPDLYEVISASHNISDMNQYISTLISNKSKLSICMVVKDIQGYTLTESLTDKLLALGIAYANSLLDYLHQSFIAVIPPRKMLYR